MNNPLLEKHTLPPFEQFQVSHVDPAIDQLLEEGRALISQKIDTSSKESILEFYDSYDRYFSRLHNAWTVISHSNAVVSTPEIREAYEKSLPKLTQFYTEIGQNKDLCKAYQTIQDGPFFAELTQEEQKALSNSLRDYRLSGVDLEGEQKKRFTEISQELSSLSTTFANNTLDATQAWKKHITNIEDLAGLPDVAIQTAAALAAGQEKEGYLLTLDIPCYIAVLTHCENRELRREMYEAFVTRASELGPNAGEFDNTETIQKLLELRHEKSQLLGFNNYAEVSLYPKMAESTEQVLDFLNQLAEKSLAQGKEEYSQLRKFALDEYGLEDMQSWDSTFYSEKMRIKLYNLSSEELRAYFSEEQAIKGLFSVAKKLFAIDFEEVTDFEKYHDDIRLFRVLRDGEHIASFYFDLYAREGKRGGAWMDICRNRVRFQDGSLQKPVVYLVCNNNGPTGDKPSLLTHSELVTLFHEFGHGLHGMLTNVDCAGVACINGVAWDAVELPSQIMENWCWERESLKLFASHYSTGEIIPDDMIDRLLRAKNYNSAIGMLRQLQFAILDFRLHTEFGQENYIGQEALMQEVLAQTAVAEVPAFNRFLNSFSHIFAGGYSAGYYSYKWAEVLSADAFSAFEEEGIFNRETGKRFEDCILSKGGSEDAADLFRRFRGRDPQVEPLLRHSGIKA